MLPLLSPLLQRRRLLLLLRLATVASKTALSPFKCGSVQPAASTRRPRAVGSLCQDTRDSVTATARIVQNHTMAKELAADHITGAAAPPPVQ